MMIEIGFNLTDGFRGWFRNINDGMMLYYSVPGHEIDGRHSDLPGDISNDSIKSSFNANIPRI